LEDPCSVARSCRKWLEASVTGRPTLASPIPDYARVIQTGTNGLLASSPDDWGAALRELIASADVRRRIGEAALEDVRRNHTTAAIAPVAAAAFAKAAAPQNEGRKLVINWLLSCNGKAELARVGGIAALLESRGHRVRLFADSAHAQPELSVYVHEYSSCSVPAADVVIASNHATAQRAAETPALFRVYAAGDGTPPAGFLCLPNEPSDADRLERLLADLCFARLYPGYAETS
jgi:hypothetical protein